MILYINDYTVYCYNMWVNCTYYHNIWVPQSIAFSCLRILRLNYMILYGRYNELVLIGLYKNQIICGGTIQWRVICLVEAGGRMPWSRYWSMFNLYTVYQPVTHSCSYGPSYISYKYIKKTSKSPHLWNVFLSHRNTQFYPFITSIWGLNCGVPQSSTGTVCNWIIRTPVVTWQIW